MNNTYPVSARVKQVFVISLVCTIVWMMLMGSAIKPLNSKQIVAFELAKTAEAAAKISKEWEEKDLIPNAKKSIYLDFVFLILYSVSIGIGCIVLSAFTGNSFLVRIGLMLSKIVPFAGLFDVVENLAMLKTLSGEITMLTVAIAFWFAILKFLIVILSLLFVIGCMIFWRIKRFYK